MRALACFVSTLQQKVLGLFHRAVPASSDASDRRERWNQTIAEYRKPLETRKEPER
jgi:hypothetical protein